MTAPGRGREPQVPAATVEAIVARTLHTAHDDGSACWSTRSLGAKHGAGKDTVQRIWKARNPGPWQADTIELANDKDFEARLVDVVGPYLDPPERAVGWFSALTRKALANTSFTSIQQLERTTDVWASHWNDDPQTFVCTKTVDNIITKVKRGRASLDRVTESTTDY